MEDRRERASSEATAHAIRDAWRAGRLDGTPHRAGPVTVDLLGVGQTYAAWHLAGPNGPDLTVRVAARPPDDMPRPMAQEAAALPYVPAGSGPRVVTSCPEDGAASPLGLPYLVTTHQPGRQLAAHHWGTEQLRAHASGLARLHRDRFMGRGGFGSGADPLGGLAPGPMSLLAEFDAAMAWWQEHHPDLCQDARTTALVAAARAVCAAAEPYFDELVAYPLVHGDLCATNVLWDGGTPHYIDFEWAQTDDPARDLAIIGGPVHGGPWYVPLDDAGVDGLLDQYVRESARLGHDLDRAVLRRRRDAWEAYERTAMLLYVRRRAREGWAGYDGIARTLGDRLDATVRTRRGV